MENDVSRFKRDFESYLEASGDNRKLAERDIDYRHLKQWSDEEKSILSARGQAAVVFDYIGEQVDYLVGTELASRQDPKAFPRTQQHDGVADAATDALRFVADKAGLQQVATECYESLLVAGTEAAIVEVVAKKGDSYDIAVRGIPWDRFYYDPHSRKLDFSDARFMGIVVWLDEDEALRIYGAKARDAEGKFSSISGEGFEDAPLGWYDDQRKRRRVCQHYYLKGGVWHVCHFSGDATLFPSKPVSFVDEDGDPVNPIVAQSAYIDRDGNRYGYVRRLIDPQNEVNHRRSKALHILNNRQVIAEEGSVKDRTAAKRELKKPDGWLEVMPGSLRENRLQVNTGGDMASGQMSMYADAVGKLQASGANAAMQGDIEGQMSGAAIRGLQRGGSVQIARLRDLHREWKLRIYRQCWMRVRQFWDAPMWVRVTDDEENLKWVGLNQPVTVGQQLLESANEGNAEAAAELQAAIQQRDPRLLTRLTGPEGVRNNVAEMDVDIIIDESPDTLTTQEDQFKMLAELAKVYGPQAVPFEALIELSAMPQKRRVLDRLKGGQGADPLAAQMAQMQAQFAQMQAEASLAETQARTAKAAADARKTNAQAEQVEVETALVRSLPDLTPNVNI